MKESQVQKKITDYLDGREFFTIKTVVTNKAGTPDVIACAPNGKFVAIEVKQPGGKLSRLQERKLVMIQEVNGIAFVAYGWEDFLAKFKTHFKEYV